MTIRQQLSITALVLMCAAPLVRAADPAEASMPEHRLALVIGNSQYVGAPLRNPGNDAHAIHTTLSALGFDVVERTDLDAEGMNQVIQEFGDHLAQQPGAVGLFYYAGHGVQAKGMNYLIPVGRSYQTEAEVEASAISLDRVMLALERGKPKLGMVVLDACRSNPFAKVATRSLQLAVTGLARMEAPSGTLIAYATAPGSVANDGQGSNGLYTQYLTHNMKVPGITVEQVFKRTRASVEADSDAAQSPREESSLKGADFYFLPLSEGKRVNPELMELRYWESIRTSQDSGDFEAYLRDYPNGKFAGMAHQNADKLRRQARTDPGLGQLGAAYASAAHGDAQGAQRVFAQLAQSAKRDDQVRGKEGLAELALAQGDSAKAAALADEALQLRPKSAASLLIKAKIAYQSGARTEATQLVARAAAVDGVADLPAQRINALLASGNLQRAEQPAAAASAYQAALRVDPQNLEALSNLVTVLRESGNPQQALALLQQYRQSPAAGTDRMLDALAYQIQQDLSERRDMDRQKMIDTSVQELVARFKEQKANPPPPPQDKWSSAPIAVSVLGFQDLGNSLGGRIGSEVLLGQELARELAARNVQVVDRALLDKVLAELKLGASSLADPDTQLRLGRLTAARLIATGRLFNLNGKAFVSFRLIDTETSQVVLNRTEEAGAAVDPIAMSERLARLAADEVLSKYPARGRIVSLQGDNIVINLGSKNGIHSGDLFTVLGDGQPVLFNGKLLGAHDTVLGRLRIAAVDEQMAYAVPLERSGSWSSNQRLQQTHGSAP